VTPVSKVTAPNKGWAEIVKIFPWHKLRRYELTNLAFELIALYFTVKFAVHMHGEYEAALLLGAVVLLGFMCLIWACKQ
jgi:hypothetical protein